MQKQSSAATSNRRSSAVGAPAVDSIEFSSHEKGLGMLAAHRGRSHTDGRAIKQAVRDAGAALHQPVALAAEAARAGATSAAVPAADSLDANEGN